MSETTVETNALASLIAKPEVLAIEGVPHVVLPPGHTLSEMEKLLPEPRRIRATITAHEVAGFVDYVNRFKTFRSALYSGPRSAPLIEARLDDNQLVAPVAGESVGGSSEQASHVTHKCVFRCPTTVEWGNWTGKDKKQQGQVEFAEFIENNLLDITKPDGASVLASVIAFQDTGRAEFRSAVRLADGRVQFQFTEKDETGELKFPERLELSIPVFEGDPGRYPLSAKLRYRIKEGALTIWYELDRPDRVLRQAYSDLLAHIEKQTGLPVHRAS